MSAPARCARRAWLCVVLALVSWPAVAQLPAPGSGTHALRLAFGGASRGYVAHLPPGAPARAPLVIVLHGTGGSGANAIEQGRWVAASERHGFIVLAPDGSLQYPNRRPSLRDNPRTWNAGPATGSWAAAANIDDIGFLRALIDAWVTGGRADPARIHATGFSNGAGMAFRAGAELADRLAGIAPVANGLLLPVARLARPVPLLLLWGEADPLNPIAGGAVRRGGSTFARASAEESWRRWGALNDCRGETSARPAPALTEYSWQRCAAGIEVRFVRIAGLGHQWPGGRSQVPGVSGPGSTALDATLEIWRFFARQPRAP
jgi:polyhydroxybutyrate depolymerase